MNLITSVPAPINPRPPVRQLDEPTNHLDLEACVWLEEYLANYKKCLVLVSHSQDFLNGVCTNIIWLTFQKLTYYTGKGKIMDLSLSMRPPPLICFLISPSQVTTTPSARRWPRTRWSR